jgi:phosphoribosylamine--glycine ligase
MHVLVVGKGGREHALVWKLSQSPHVKRLSAAPGNAGTARLADNVDIPDSDTARLADYAEREKVDLTVVGPEAPLSAGIVDAFTERSLRIFGPSAAAAELESSKAFAKRFMTDNHIPTAAYRIFENPDEALGFVKTASFPVVIKADGLAAGKGVAVCSTLGEAEETIISIMVEKIHGSAGARLIVEQHLAGDELSVMAFSDGKTVVPMIPAQDHKRAYEGDSGPNTGGMGAVAPVLFPRPGVMDRIRKEILEPTIEGLSAMGRPYVGVLYAGLMLTDHGPKVLEYNCRFGDPEAQVVLPLLRSDLVEIVLASLAGELELAEVEFSRDFCICVIAVSGGYPGPHETGFQVRGFGRVNWKEVEIFHAGTKHVKSKTFTAGGRVVGVTAWAPELATARERAYRNIRHLSFEGVRYRADIAEKYLLSIREKSRKAHA